MLEKIVQILIIANQPVLKDHIVRKCGFSTLQANRYINRLVESGLLDAYPATNLRLPGRKTNRRLLYQTSKKGKELLERYNKLLTLLEISPPPSNTT